MFTSRDTSGPPPTPNRSEFFVIFGLQFEPQKSFTQRAQNALLEHKTLALRDASLE